MTTPNNDEVIFSGRAIPVNAQAQADLQALVRKVHAAKGRHHTQLAMCDLFDAVGLPNTRPVPGPGRRHSDAVQTAHLTAKQMDHDVVVLPVVDQLAAMDISLSAPANFNGAMDPLYARALALVLQYNRGSISLVQRHLRIGYNRAACMLEAMELAGVLTPVQGLGGREVIPHVDRKKPCDTEGGSHD